MSATLDGFPVSDSIIQGIEQVLGVTSVYRDIDYRELNCYLLVQAGLLLTIITRLTVKLVAVLPWFSLIFSVIAGVILHISARREGAPVDRDDAPPGVSTTEHGEKSKKIETEGQA